MKLDVYENLRRINAGYDQAIRSLAALRKHGAFHRGALAIPSRLARDFAQDMFGDRYRLGRGQKQEVFLDCRGQVQKRHELADASRGNVAQPGQFPVVAHGARSDQLV